MSISSKNEQINYLRIYIPQFGSRWPRKSKKWALFFPKSTFLQKSYHFIEISKFCGIFTLFAVQIVGTDERTPNLS